MKCKSKLIHLPLIIRSRSRVLYKVAQIKGKLSNKGLVLQSTYRGPRVTYGTHKYLLTSTEKYRTVCIKTCSSAKTLIENDAPRSVDTDLLSHDSQPDTNTSLCEILISLTTLHWGQSSLHS